MDSIYRLAATAAFLCLLPGAAGAQQQRVHFRSNGGSWSHTRHSGWHRYWGGPSIGFYFAPAPVYVVSGYAAPNYYAGSSFWYSNPSFGLSIQTGGGGGGGGHARLHRGQGGHRGAANGHQGARGGHASDQRR